MGLFKRRSSVDPAELAAVRAELAEVRQRLSAVDVDKRIVDNRLASLDAAASALGERTSLVESISEKVGQLDVSPRLAELHEQLAAVTARLDGVDVPRADGSTAAVADEALAALDARVSDIAVQLAAVDALTLQLNQLNIRVLTQADLQDQMHRVQEHLATTQTLADRVDVLEAKVTDVPAAATADLEPLNARIDELQHQLAQVRDAAPDLRGVYERLDALDARSTEPPAMPDVDDIVRRIGELEASVPPVASLEEIRARIDEVDAVATAARERSDVLDQRLASVSTELANQLAELSGELDEVGTRQTSPDGAAVAELDQAIGALRTTQIRLASEQARYEIAFREDLAALADQLRRQRT